ncbi:MAG TPA: PAS domain S-box protein [Chryseosolibacter sp.]|nr:PAS domain S-box protein [Chryseosolibacter sp.]
MKKNDQTILLVDDKKANIIALQSLLEKPGRAFVQSMNGREALKIALNKSVDLIILDVQMPDMDGFEVAHILRSNKKTKDIPIIFASAEKTEQQSMLKGFEEGAIDYLFKPLNPEITKAKVSVLLKFQMQKKELVEKNQSLEKSALLINNSADIIGIIDVATSKFEEVNNAFSVITGYPIEEVNGTSVAFFLGNDDRLHVQDLLQSKKHRLSFESSIHCKDRSIKWLQWNVTVKYNKWFINARDITEIKQVEKIRNYLATVVKQSSDAIYIHDHEGKIISWNEGAEKIYGYSEREALEMKIWNIIPEFLQPESQLITGRIFAGGKIQMLQTKRITKHGKIVDVLFSASVIVDTNQPPSIAITERDITLQKVADEKIRELNLDLKKNVLQLEETNKELESFSYSVSHDLRSPLRAIDGNARILEEDYPDRLDEQGISVIHKISSNVKKMETLINDLLEFSKIGKKAVRKSIVSTGEQVRSVISDISSVTRHRAQITVLPLSDSYVDHVLFNQVWANLISNAIKYSAKKEEPVVEIGQLLSGEDVVYYVRDNGAGFDMEYADKLFGTFQRLHHASEFEGTGIGLAIVKRIILKHGGRIWAEAKPDEGATFYFTVPPSDPH